MQRSEQKALRKSKARAKRWGWGFAATVFALGLGFSSQAHAQNACAMIRSELASLHNGGGGGASAQLQQAIAQQSRELGQAQIAYERFQCSFGASPQCGSIVATINQMQINMDQMQRRLARTGGGGNQRRIAELERAFALRCGSSQRQVAEVRQQPRPGNLLEAIFGVRSQPVYQARRPDPSGVLLPQQPDQRGFYRPGDELREQQPRLRGSTFRTMCVRTSDGFYWPISFSTTRDRFDEDRSACAAMCPGTQVELYAYRNPGEQVDAMLNTLTLEPYTAQEYAFAYRENFDPANRCTPSASVLADLQATVHAGLQSPGPRVPQPSPRPDMASDPETRALEDGGVSFAGLGAMTRPAGEGQEMVRVVGPNYGYFAN